MKSAEIIRRLKKEFPGKKIIPIPSDNPTEIICEIEPGVEVSIAIAYVRQSVPHYHRVSQETYTVEEGVVSLQVTGKQNLLKEGQSHIVKPGKVHSASGDWARVRVESVPGWTKEDHILTSRRR